MAHTITVNGTAYEVKRKLNYGEVIKVRSSNANLLGLTQKSIAEATDEQLAELTAQIMTKTNEQDKFVADILQACIAGMTDERLNALDYLDAAILFNELYEYSTIIRKNSETG
jgi:hypothetical protein